MTPAHATPQPAAGEPAKAAVLVAVDPADALAGAEPPKRSDTAARPAHRQDISALSFDQVNDNADELIELRGEGRYFGVTDPASGKTVNSKASLGPLCANCHKRGHIRANCKTVVCHKCGVVGDHYETQCPTTLVCARCNGKGHMAVNCTGRAKKRAYCKNCDMFSHNDDQCPQIWRSYITNPTAGGHEAGGLVLPNLACYNCGSKDHYGDECREPRTSRVPNVAGSAFSGNNLPAHLRKAYFGAVHKRALPEKPSFGPQKANFHRNQSSQSSQSKYAQNVQGGRKKGQSSFGAKGRVNTARPNSTAGRYANYNANYGASAGQNHASANRAPPNYTQANHGPHSYANSGASAPKRKPVASRSGVIKPKAKNSHKSLPNKPAAAAPTRTGYLDTRGAKNLNFNNLY